MADIEMTDMAPPKQQQLQAEQSVGQKRKAEDHLSSSPAPASHCAPASPARVASLPSVVGQPASAGSGGSSDKENKPAQKKAKLDEGGKGKDKEKEAAVGVELTKGGKWSVKQKVVELCDVSNAVKKGALWARARRRDDEADASTATDVITLTDELEALTEPLQAFSEAQLLVVARLVHESSVPETARNQPWRASLTCTPHRFQGQDAARARAALARQARSSGRVRRGQPRLKLGLRCAPTSMRRNAG